MTTKQQQQVVDLAFRVKTGAQLTQSEQADAVPLLGAAAGESLLAAADRTLGQFHERSGPFADPAAPPPSTLIDSFVGTAAATPPPAQKPPKPVEKP